MVVYRNLLFFTVTVQAGGQDKIPKVREKILSPFLLNGVIPMKKKRSEGIDFLYGIMGNLYICLKIQRQQARFMAIHLVPIHLQQAVM